MEQVIYELMHKDNRIARIRFSKNLQYIDDIKTELPELMPIRANRSLEDFRSWWTDRAIPRTRRQLADFLAERGYIDVNEYLIKNLALSLSDCYWIRPDGSGILWKDVNLYSNNFGLIQQEENNGLSSFSPDASTGGNLPKWWILEENERFLLKGNEGGTFQQSFNEVFSSQIHELQDKIPFKDYVPYELKSFPKERIGCISKAFTSMDMEYIPAWDIIGRVGFRTGDVSRADFIDILEKNGLNRDYIINFMDYMALSDFIIANDDRHFNNFGVLRDSNTLALKSMAPLFDFGNSMGFGHSIDNSILLFEEIKGFNNKYAKSLKNVENLSLIDIEKLPSKDFTTTFYLDSDMSEKNINKLAISYQERINILKGLQEGKSFYEMTKQFRR